MIKYSKILPILLLTFFICAKAKAVVCVDLETHNKLTTVDKSLNKQISTLENSEELLLTIKDLMSGNIQQNNTILSNSTFYSDISQLKIPHLNKSHKISAINKNIDRIYPLKTQKASDKQMLKFQQQQQIQAELKQAVLYSTKVINESKYRTMEIENLVRESDQKRTLKDSIDFQSKLFIELAIELKKNNELLALMVRNQAKGQYKGLINIKRSNDNDDYNLSSSKVKSSFFK